VGSGIVLPPVTGPMVLSHSRERPALPSCSHVHVRLGVRPWAKNPGLPGILSLHTHHLHLLAQPQLRRHAFPAGSAPCDTVGLFKSIWGLLAPPCALRAGKPQSGQERPTVSLRRAVDALQRGRVGRVAAGGKVAGRVGSLRTGRRGARRCPCPSCPLHTRRTSPAQSPWAISTGACRAQRSDLALALPPSCPVSGVHWWGDED
jgi:hypothetical protein